MMITDSGIIIRTPAKDVSTYSRTASGVIMMRLEQGQKIVNITKVAKEEETELPEGDESVEGAVEGDAAVNETTEDNSDAPEAVENEEI
jgi:DNA gyrase/topoisomerase IV subunit A